MNIEKLEIKGFGKLYNVTLLFDKGLNIVFGDNEAGKSTIQGFIKAMFFGLKGGKTSKDGTLPPLKRYKPWSGTDYTGFMEYRLSDGQLYRIGRNFGTNSVRVFDTLFNDITNTFDASKEKGIAFAEKQLGINEECFDKTVFVRQMETKIGEDGSRELHSRIVNISQTGFEDISFKRAQEALKEALRNYVGTDKTSTRPLDKVVVKLSQLKARREGLVNKRESMFSMENELGNTAALRNNLEGRKAYLEALKRVIDIRNDMEKSRKLKTQIEEILRNINTDEEELKVVLEREKDFNREKNELNSFSIYDNNDIDALEIQYHKLLHIQNEELRLGNELYNKEKELSESRLRLEPILAFSELEEGIESHVIEINKDLEYLKKDYEKSNIGILNEKIKNTENKVRNYRLVSIISVVMAGVLFGLGFTEIHIGFFISPVALGFTIFALLLKSKLSKELSGYLDDKRISFININSVIEEINKKQNMLLSIYGKVNACSIEEFLKLKAEYGNMSKHVATLNGEISKLENERTINSSEISRLKNDILARLMEAGVLGHEATAFNEEHIKNFKYGVRKYKGIEPSINYALQRKEDINKNLQRHYKNAEAVCGKQLGKKECLQEKLDMAEAGLIKLKEELNAEINGIDKQLYDGFFAKILPDMSGSSESMELTLFNENYSEEYTSVEDEYDKICKELNNTLLNMREYETLLKGISGDDSELQIIEEEIEELEARKGYLEDVNLSLKTALDVLTEASDEIQKDFVPMLNHSMADTINKITAGKYSDLRADNTLALKVIAPETGDVVSISSLSGGTIDQMYLALRIAMADMVVQTGEKLPFIMDEAFAQYDDMRTRETFEFLRELSKQRQIIFFTCKGREVEIARQIFKNDLNVITL